MKEWINVQNKLPEQNKLVEVKTHENEVFKAQLNESVSFGFFSGNGIYSNSWYDDEGDFIPNGKITHWRS